MKDLVIGGDTYQWADGQWIVRSMRPEEGPLTSREQALLHELDRMRHWALNVADTLDDAMSDLIEIHAWPERYSGKLS